MSKKSDEEKGCMEHFHALPYFLIRFIISFLLCPYSRETVPMFAEVSSEPGKIGRFVFRIKFEIPIFAYIIIFIIHLERWI